MKRLASWLRQIANEIDPPARRGRPSRAAERNAAAVDALFAESDEVLHGWPEEPASCSKCGRAHGRRSCR